MQATSPEEIAARIADGAHLLTVGMTMSGASETILRAIEQRWNADGHPADLTLVHSAGQSNRQDGIQHLAHPGLVTRIIGSHWGLAPRWMDLISENQVVAYCLPQGQMTHWYRAMAAGLPGHLTQIGLGTFIDPRLEGGKMNRRTADEPDLVQVVTVAGDEFLWIPALPIDWVIIRGTEADERGNLTAREEAMKLELLPAVLAARRFHGQVAAQVKALVPRGRIPPREVDVPGVHIDWVTVAANPARDHRQTDRTPFMAQYSSEGWDPSLNDGVVGPLDLRRLIGRRALLELRPGDIVNLGTGIPNDVIGAEVLHEGVQDQVTMTVESGVYGGRSVGGLDFGIAEHPDALIEHPYQFDFYNGRGVDITFMGFGELDADGCVNATRLGSRATGAGGFIDITQCARTVVFCGTFTTQGLRADVADGRLAIQQEGQIAKCVARVQQVSFDGERALRRGQRVIVVTERVVFTWTLEGWRVLEVAPGVHLANDILSHMAFRPVVPDDLPRMDPALFREGGVGLLEHWAAEAEAQGVKGVNGVRGGKQE